MNRNHAWVALAAIVCVLPACARPAAPDVEQSVDRTPHRSLAGLAGRAQVSASAATRNADVAPEAPRQLIRTATLELKVDHVADALGTIDSIARTRESALSDVRVNREDNGAGDAYLVLRVPSTRLDETMIALRRVGQVRAEAVTAEDVSKAYMDLATRLAVKEETAARLRALLRDHTGKLSDVLAVEGELSRVITELEQMKGEQRYYDQRIATSTITVTISETAAIARPALVRPVSEALHNSVLVLVTSIAWLFYGITFIVPWVTVGLILWWVGRAVRALWRKRAWRY